MPVTSGHDAGSHDHDLLATTLPSCPGELSVGRSASRQPGTCPFSELIVAKIHISVLFPVVRSH